MRASSTAMANSASGILPGLDRARARFTKTTAKKTTVTTV